MRSILGAERARLRREGIIPQRAPYVRREVWKRERSYVLDRRTGETVLEIVGPKVWVGPPRARVAKPPFTPFSTVDPVSGERRSGYTVRPPGWEQFIKIDPILGTTPAEKKARKRQLAEQIAHSPTPQVVQGIASIMTTLDDIQDAAVTLSVAGRFAARFFPKLIPGVGVISTVADVLNIGTWACVGGRGYHCPPRKKHLEDAGKKTQGTYRKRLAEQVRTGKFRVGWGEIFQILQTTANLVDIGIEIGAGLGYAIDLLFGLVRGADIVLPCWLSRPLKQLVPPGELVTDPCDPLALAVPVGGPGWYQAPIQFQTIGALGYLDKAFGLPVGTVDQKLVVGSQWMIDAGKRALQGWPMVGLLQDDLSFDDHLSVMYALHSSQQVMSDVMERYEIQPFIDELYDRASIQAPPVRDRDTWDAIRAVGGNPADPRLPVYGAPREMPYAEFIAESRESWARGWRGWLGKAPSVETWWYATQLLDSLFDVQAWALEGPNVQFETAYTREFQAVLNLVEANVVWPDHFTPAEITGRIKRLSERLSPPAITKLGFQETLSLVGMSDGGYSTMAGRPIVDSRAT